MNISSSVADNDVLYVGADHVSVSMDGEEWHDVGVARWDDPLGDILREWGSGQCGGMIGHKIAACGPSKDYTGFRHYRVMPVFVPQDSPMLTQEEVEMRCLAVNSKVFPTTPDGETEP